MGEAEGARGELVLCDQGGGVLVHAHGDHGVGVAQAIGDGADGDLLGQQPDRVGVAQVVRMRTLLVGPSCSRLMADIARCQTRAKLADDSGPPGRGRRQGW